MDAVFLYYSRIVSKEYVFLFKSNKKFDVIHAYGFAAGFITRVLTIFFPIKRKVISTHFIYPQMKKGSFSAKIFQWVFSGFDKILLIGEASGQQLKSLGVDGSKMEVFHHWLDPKIFAPKDKNLCRKKLNLLNVKMVVLYIGRILKMKGVFNLLEVAKSLPQEILTVFVGDGPDFEELEMKAEGISNVFLAGRRSHGEVIDFLGAGDFSDSLVLFLLIFWLITAKKFSFNSQVSEGVALFFLALTPIYLISQKEPLAEKTANWAYMFLVATVIQF